MKQLTVRNVSPEIAKALEQEKQRRGQSLNQTVLELLRQVLGLAPQSRYDNGLGRLAGTWGEEELKKFEESMAVFEQVDEEIWR